jgi:hypothetical protein
MGQDANGIRDILADGRQQQMDLFGYCAWGWGGKFGQILSGDAGTTAR